MAMGEAVIVAGIGCRRGASAAAIEAVIAAALARAGLDKGALSLIAAPAPKCEEPGIATTASARGVPLVAVSEVELKGAGARGVTRSERSLARMGVPSVAEAAALAAAGTAGRLLLPRLALGPATCALATNGEAP
jgi:cobalt-precorrin 5A hydrolase